MISRTFAVSLIGIVTHVQARIKKDGKWTEHDYCEQDDIGVCYVDGVPKFKEEDKRKRILDAAMGVEGTPSDWMDSQNVKNIKLHIHDATKWADAFPERHKIYTFNEFL